MKDISKLLKEVESYYKTEGRSHLPWRKTKDPYKILVSEVMLQQTQVDRVLPFYKNFLKEFPTPQALAKAPLSKVLLAWQGLGYNRRAKFLHQAAKVISNPKLAKSDFASRGHFPKTVSALQELPGIGPYTAGAIAAFAYNSPEVFIETNIRTVFIFFCYRKPRQNIFLGRDEQEPYSPVKYFDGVSDEALLPLVQTALKKTKLEPRDFYAALMDYGAKLKREGVKLNKQSKHYTKQSKFEGSARQLRGAILRELLQKPNTRQQLTKKTKRTSEEVKCELEKLQRDKLISKKGTVFVVSK